MNRLLFCEPWPVSNLNRSVVQFLDGIISILITLFFRRLFAAGCARCLSRVFLNGLGHRLFALRPWPDRGLVAVGQDLGDAQHRDFVAVAALAARILAAALLERDHLGA